MAGKSAFLRTVLLIIGLIVMGIKITRTADIIGGYNTAITAIPLIIVAAIYLYVRPRLRKLYAQLLWLILCLGTAIILPYGYLYGLMDFKRVRESQEIIVHDFNRGGFDSILSSNPYRGGGVRLSAHKGHIIDIYADSSLRMVFFYKHFHNSYFCGDLFISNPKLISDRRLYGFLKREFDYRKLNDNWFWIEAYTDK